MVFHGRQYMPFGLFETNLISDVLNFEFGDSDSLKEMIADTLGSNSVTDHVPGWVASARLRYENVSLLGEYLAWIERFAVDEVEFAGHGAKPTSWLIEAAYDFGLAGKDATVAAGYQGQAEALALKLPTLRFLAGLSVAMTESFALAIEWSYDESASKDGGSGERANTIKVQVATEF